MSSSIIWSYTSTGYCKPAAVQLSSLCKHVPLKSVAAAWPAVDAVAAPQDSQRRLQQPGDAAYKAVQLQLEEVVQKQQQQLLEQTEADQQTKVDIAAAAASQCQTQYHSSSSSSSQQCNVREVHEQLLQEQQGECLIAFPEQTADQQAGLQSLTYGYTEQLWHLPQWQVVQCSAAQLDQPNSSSTCVADAAAVPEASLYGGSSTITSSSIVGTNVSSSTHGCSKQGSSSQRQGNTQQTHPVAAPQPEPLYRLVAAAKQRQQYDLRVLQQLLQQLQPLLPQLLPEHLAHAAWAAAQLAEQLQPSQAWLSALLEAAESCFQGSNYSSSSSSSRQMAAAFTATLLQALVKLRQQPSQAWLSACCSSMHLQQWTCPRALSTVAACLPQLGHVPEACWAESFFAATAAALPAFPAISLARMLHGVTAWGHLHQQQQQDDMGPGSLRLVPPQSWLLQVLTSLNQHSSQLKPAELAMVLQSLQRLQQQQQLLLPVAGQQASSELQQAGQQLLHSLMAAVLQQLPKFQAKDLTVMLFAVASLHEQQQQQQQQQGVSWLWLLRVLKGVEARLPKLDARAQATCLAAAATLIKPHLQQPRQQQQQQPAGDTQQQQQQGGVQQQAAAEQAVRPVPPLQRWLQLQQSMAQSEAAAAAGPPATTHLQHHPDAASTSSSAANQAAAAADVADYWRQWLNSFFAHSSRQLHSFSAEDLTVTACSLASSQLVPPVSWYEELLGALQQQLPGVSAGQVSGVAWALGRMALLPSQHNAVVSLVPSGAWMQRLYTVPDEQQQQPQVLAAAVQDDGPAAVTRACRYSLSSCSAAELVRLMWAAGVCDFNPGDTWWAAAEQQLQQALQPPSATCSTLPDTSNNSSTGASSASSKQLPVYLLGSLLQAYAAARRPVPATMQHCILAPEITQQLLQQPAVHTVRLLRGLQQSGCSVPQGWLQQLSAGLQPLLTQLGPGELPRLLGCLADAGLSLNMQQQQQQQVTIVASAADVTGVSLNMPQQQQQQLQETDVADVAGVSAVGLGGSDSLHSSNATTAAAAGFSAFSSRSFRDACLLAGMSLLPRLSVREASLLLWSCAKLQLKPPAAWLEAVLARMQANFVSAELPELALGIAACARLGFVPSGDWLGCFMMATHRKVAAMAAGPVSSKLVLARLVLQLLWALGGLKVAQVSPKWMKQLLLSVHAQLPLMGPRYVASLLQALAQLQCRPSPVYLQSLLDRLGDLSCYSTADLLQLLQAAAALRWQPNRRWLGAFLSATYSQQGQGLAGMNPQQLAQLHWSLAVLRVTPPERWRMAAVAAVSAQLSSFDARSLATVVWAWGRLMVHLVPKSAGDKQRRSSRAAGRQQQILQQQVRWRLLQLRLARQLQSDVPHSGDVSLASSASSSSSEQLPEKRRQVLNERGKIAEAVLAAAWELRGSYSASSLAYLLVGVAKMGLQPDQAWLQGMALHGSNERLSVLNGYELQQLVWALARLKFVAPEGWLGSVAVLLEVRAQRHDSTRHSAAWALGRLQQLAAAKAGHQQEQHARADV